MNISAKCNCCVKNDVCKFTKEYETACAEFKKVSEGTVAEFSAKCKYFIENNPNYLTIKGGI